MTCIDDSLATGLLDRVTVGLLLLDERSRVRCANRLAHRLLCHLDQFEIGADDVLRCADPDIGLADIVSRLCRGKAEGGTRSLELPASGGGEILLEAERHRVTGSGARSAYALVTLIESHAPYTPDVERLARRFNLSAAETAVCALMLDGLTNREIADRRCVGSETIRSQVTSVLRKAQVSRRMHLFRLAARTSPPSWQ